MNKHRKDIRYFLHYPLIAIELGLDSGVAHSISNENLRDTFGFLVKKTINEWGKIETKKGINKKGFETYLTKESDFLSSLYHETLTLMEIKDGSSYAKSVLNKIDNSNYKLITSLVTNKYNEENLYFYGFDNPEKQKTEAAFIALNLFYFTEKYFAEVDSIDNLLNDIDYELLNYSKQKIMIDLNKLHSDTKSTVFSSIDKLADVLAFLYYMAMVKNMKRKILLMIYDKDAVIDECLIHFSKEWIIEKITNIFKINKYEVTKIINYLTNTGQMNILEFPLFEYADALITIPSLIIINDWSFTLVNGHHIKNIPFIKQDKTISRSTELKLESALQNVNNVLFCKEKYYECLNNKKEIIKSDIDFAILDYEKNILIVMETKWKTNHYYFGTEKHHIKIQDTLNKIYNEQIAKHKIYLSDKNNILTLFNNDKRINLDDNVKIYYLAVDKRNQLHIDEKHMITEYMLIYLIKKFMSNNKIDLNGIIEHIESLHTDIEYISIPPTIKISMSNNVSVEVDSCDLTLNYK